MLGRALGERLRDREARLVDIEDCDITHAASVRNLFAQWPPDVVIHTAAYTDVDACESDAARARTVNVDGAVHVATEAARCGSRLISISSDYVFGGEKGRPCRETDAPAPLSVYGRTKWEGEQGVMDHHPAPVIFRTCGLYGPGGRHFPGAVARRIRAREPLQVVGDQIVSPTYSSDLARTIVSCLDRPISGIYHAANDGAVSWADFAREIAAVMGAADFPITVIPSSALNRAAARPAFSALDCGKLAAEHGLRLRGWRDALRAFYEDEGGRI